MLPSVILSCDTCNFSYNFRWSPNPYTPPPPLRPIPSMTKRTVPPDFIDSDGFQKHHKNTSHNLSWPVGNITGERVHRLAMAIFWRTFRHSHDGISAQPEAEFINVHFR
jgi:hypothetical protein